MNKIVFFLLLILVNFQLKAQYSTSPDSLGSSAIYKDSSILIGWATSIDIKRGYLDINDKTYQLLGSNKVSYGTTNFAIGKAQGNSVDCISLGDSGVVTATFQSTIYNGAGPDFAIFENSFADNYLELAFVEVSSDGINFVRFPNISEYPCQVQVGPYAYANLKKVNNLAGKYRQGFGTPFDLEELKDSAKVDISAVSHIRIIDVIGSISNILSKDSQGDTINDCYPTPFPSGGFDLDAIGVMYLNALGINSNQLESTVSIYPNPSNGFIWINSLESGDLKIVDLSGKTLLEKRISTVEKIDVSSFSNSFILISFQTDNQVITKRVWVK